MKPVTNNEIAAYFEKLAIEAPDEIAGVACTGHLCPLAEAIKALRPAHKEQVFVTALFDHAGYIENDHNPDYRLTNAMRRFVSDVDNSRRSGEPVTWAEASEYWLAALK